MKIVFATGIFPPDIGGPATYVDGVAREFLGSGTAVEVITYGDSAGSDVPFPVTRISRSRAIPMRYASFFRAVRRSLRGDAVAYLQDPVSAGLPAALAGLSRKKPYVVKIVGDLAWEIGRERGLVEDEIEAFQVKRYSGLVERVRTAERFVAKRAARIVTPSHFLEGIVAGWGVAPEKIDVVYNAVRFPKGLPSARDDARKVLGLEGDPILITAGRMVPWKGFETIVDAMPDILAKHPAARLLIVGQGPGEKDLRRRIEASKLGGAVQLTGTLDKNAMALHLRASDIFVLASTYEGFSHLLLEAMLAGVPVVASRVGGNPELIEDGENGLLATPERAAMAEAVMRVADDAELRAKLARNGRERVRHFRWEDMVSRTYAILQKVADVSSNSSR